jgi:RND family efflux transporter MFP subunit
MLVVIAFWALSGSISLADQALVFYTVKRGDLPITVTESGNLESQQSTDLRCQVENSGYDRSGSSGTQIIFIVPNGKMVKGPVENSDGTFTEGELLVELDSAQVRDRLDSQVLATERATSEQIQADVKFENQKTQNITLLEEAKLKVQLAKLELKQYEDEQGGTFQIEMQNIELTIQISQGKRLIQETNLRGIEVLKKLGYRSRGQLAQARLDALVADRTLAKDISSRKELVDNTYQKNKLKLQGSVDTGIRSLEQVKRDNRALIAQTQASKNAADRSLVKEEEKLKKYTEQLDKCKIYAVHDGMATYAVEIGRSNRSSTNIAEGATVRERQRIITLPQLSKMQVKTAVHESVLDHIHEGLKATISIDAFPDIKFKGSIKSVAVLPDAGGWLSSDIKVYKTIVTIDGEVTKLKPGMTAVVEIHVDRLKNVLSVPVQAIVQIRRENWCYVNADGDIERRVLQLGRTNDKFVEVKSGLNEGDRVVLNPMSVVDDAEDRQMVISPDDDADGLFDDEEINSTSSNDKNGTAESTNKAEKDSIKKTPTDKSQSKKGKKKKRSGGSGGGLMRYDTDGDGKVSLSSEVPERMRSFIERVDTNSDGFLDAKEIAAAQKAAAARGGGNRGRGNRTPGGQP